MKTTFTGLLGRSGIEETHHRIGPFIHRTPVLVSTAIDSMIGARVFFKCENFQKIGAFKIRGASNAAALLSESERQRGLATHSSGNHAQAVARAAQRLGLPAYIVMPGNAPAVKRAAVEGYGATVIESGPRIEDREETMESVLSETGAAFIHPFDDDRVISGQATAARELLQDHPELDILMAPVGGGGLMSGTCLSARYFGRSAKSAGTVGAGAGAAGAGAAGAGAAGAGGAGAGKEGSVVRCFGCEPAGADDAARSLAAGRRLTNSRVETIADGLRTNLSDRTFEILSHHLEDIITVTDDQIGSAMRLIYERLKVVVEPSAAVPLAALISRREHFRNRRIGIIFSGGNVDFQQIDLSRWNAPS